MLHHALRLSPGNSSLPGDTFDFSSCWTQTAKTEQGWGRGRRAGWSTGPRLLELPTNERTARNAGLGRLGGRRELRSCCDRTFVLTPRGLERGLRAPAESAPRRAADAQCRSVLGKVAQSGLHVLCLPLPGTVPTRTCP